MSYESPISMFVDKIHREFNEKLDEHIYKEVYKVGITVDKEELIKALKYDRNQYEKGFKDGVQNAFDRLFQLKKFVNECITGCYVCMDYHFGSCRRDEDKAELKAYENVLREINEMLGVEE